MTQADFNAVHHSVVLLRQVLLETFIVGKFHMIKKFNSVGI